MSVQAGTNIKKNYLPVFEEYPEVTGFFSLKDGAVEGSPYNNPEMFRQLGLEDAVRVWPTQVHETRVAVIRQEDVDAAKAAAEAGISLMLEGSAQDVGETRNHIQANSAPGDQMPVDQNPGDYSPAIIIPGTDGTITNRKNVLLTTVHADCLAVFCYDPVKEAIGLCHAGWRGTCAGIAMEMVEKIEGEYGCDPEDLQIYIGPGISQCCFEAGMEVAEAFAENWTFAEDYITRTPGDVANGKCHIDIKGINQEQLELMGIPTDQIRVSEHCTCCEPQLFCSYRREGGTYMRMGGGLCMKEK